MTEPLVFTEYIFVLTDPQPGRQAVTPEEKKAFGEALHKNIEAKAKPPRPLSADERTLLMANLNVIRGGPDIAAEELEPIPGEPGLFRIIELAPRRPLESTDSIPYHVARTKSVSVVVLKSGRWGVARVRRVSDPATRNVATLTEADYGVSNLSSGFVHVSAHATRDEAEKAAWALAQSLGLTDGWT